jgi:hypothetical protein
MREAQEMMNDPSFQAQMKKITESSVFKQHMEAQQELLKDPRNVKELEKTMQKKLKEGNELLERTKAERDAQKEAFGDKEEAVKTCDEAEGEAEKKPASKKEEQEDSLPDIPNLNLN